MVEKFLKALAYFEKHGFLKTAKKVFTYPFEERTYERFTATLKNRDAASVFQEIYERNIWGNQESRSGDGSTLAHTENLRAHLPLIFQQFNIQHVLDLPCGDFNWMKEVPLTPGMSYFGADIVQELIQRNESLYENSQRKFGVVDILSDPLPPADLLICRDCLFHFSFKDIRRALNNIRQANITYLLTTTYPNGDKTQNIDIDTGSYRKIDLFAEPFGFPEDVLYRLDDHIPGDTPREMCLWRVDQLS